MCEQATSSLDRAIGPERAPAIGNWTAPSFKALPRRAGRGAPMSVALGLVLGGFVLLAVASVMGVGIWTGYRSTVALLEQKADLMLSAAERRTRDYLDAAENQLGFVAGMIADGEATPGIDEAFTNLLFGALASAPQIVTVLYVDADQNLVGAERDAEGVRPLFRNIAGDAELASALARAQDGGDAHWSGLIWREEYGQALLCYEQPVMVGGGLAGVLIAMVSLRDLSEFVGDLESDFGANAFVLYGRDRVMAHPLLAFDYPGLTALQPLPRQATFGDPVLASMWQEDGRAGFESGLLTGTDGHAVRLGEQVYAFIYSSLAGYGQKPLLIGAYFRSSDLFSEVLRLKWAAVACITILLVAVAAAAITGRRIARPIRRLAQGAERVHALDLANVPPVPGSFFKEIDDAAHAFNAMLDGLRWFERYVPRSLVTRHMNAQGEDAVPSSERSVTVMFTDIAGFTGLSEDLPAGAVADLLNQQFALQAACIEANGGTVDNYVGDSVMAVWGAPEQDLDGPHHACRAALDIAEALDGENAARRRRGLPPIALRIGIHTGPVVAGHIGSPGRIHYTVVGDTVNTAKRLDEIGKAIGGRQSGDAKILISGATARALGPGAPVEFLGPCRVRGKERHVDVFALHRESADRRDAA